MSSQSWQQGTFVSRADQVRRSNERIIEEAIRLRFVSRVPLLCECDDEDCREFVPLTLDEYELVRAVNGYVTSSGHSVGEDATAI